MSKMSKELTRTKLAGRRLNIQTNTIAFPRALRDAIPDLCDGRVLKLDSINGGATDSPPVPASIETGGEGDRQTSGEFTVRIDLDQCRALAETLAKLAERTDGHVPGLGCRSQRSEQRA